MYSCSNIFGVYTVDFIWILMRYPWEIGSQNRQDLSEKAKRIIKNTLSDKYVSEDFLIETE